MHIIHTPIHFLHLESDCSHLFPFLTFLHILLIFCTYFGTLIFICLPYYTHLYAHYTQIYTLYTFREGFQSFVTFLTFLHIFTHFAHILHLFQNFNIHLFTSLYTSLCTLNTRLYALHIHLYIQRVIAVKLLMQEIIQLYTYLLIFQNFIIHFFNSLYTSLCTLYTRLYTFYIQRVIAVKLLMQVFLHLYTCLLICIL